MLLIRAVALPPLPGQPLLVHILLLRGKGMRLAEGTPAAARRTEFRLKEPRWRLSADHRRWPLRVPRLPWLLALRDQRLLVLPLKGEGQGRTKIVLGGAAWEASRRTHLSREGP